MGGQELFINQRRLIREYIEDNFNVYPGYYVWKKESFMDWSWKHYICKDILDVLDLNYKKDARIVLDEYCASIEHCLNSAKTPRSLNLFEIAIDVVHEMEGLFV